MHQPCSWAAEESEDDSAEGKEDNPGNAADDAVSFGNDVVVRCLSQGAMCF